MTTLRYAALAALLWLASAGAAFAQQTVALWCFNPSGSQATNNLYVPCSSTNPLVISGTVTSTVANPVGITPTDHTITSASGASQQIMAANVSRHSLTIVNTGNANCGVNPTGGTAAISGAGTLTLAPLGAYTPRIPTLSAVTVICTSGQPIYADDN
jgi:hypothetical protein